MKRDIYQHYSGKLYKIIDLSRHSEALATMVVCQNLYNNYTFGFDLKIQKLHIIEKKLNALYFCVLLLKNLSYLGKTYKNQTRY